MVSIVAVRTTGQANFTVIVKSKFGQRTLLAHGAFTAAWHEAIREMIHEFDETEIEALERRLNQDFELGEGHSLAVNISANGEFRYVFVDDSLQIPNFDFETIPLAMNHFMAQDDDDDDDENYDGRDPGL